MSHSLRVPTLSAVLLCAMWAQADANKAQLGGTVTDPNQAVMPNVTVKIRNTATGLYREAKTNESGLYRAVLLDPGTYAVEAEATGFAKASFTGVTLTVGSSVTLDIPLSIQQTSTTVEVGAAALSVDTSAQSSTVNLEAITNLPINGRRFQDFAQLAPTAQVDTNTRGQISFAGQRGIYSNIMLDGADYNQPFFGGIRGGERSNSVITVPQSAIQEFQVVPTGYTAEYGRSTGGIMNTITKSGTNGVHGEAFYQNRNRELSAKSPIPAIISGRLTQVKPSETLQQFGGGIGGPIKKDKLFYFGAFEAQKANTPRQVQFPQLTGIAETVENAQALRYFRSLEVPFEQTNRAVAGTAKMDYLFSNGDRLTFRYSVADSNEVNAATVGGAINPFTNSAVSNEGIEKDGVHNGTMQYTKLISASVVNDFRFTGSAEVRPRLANAAAPTVTSTIGTFGTRSFLPTTQDDKRWQLSDSVSVTKGRHTLKIGTDLNWLSAGQFFAFNQFGAFAYATSDLATILRTMSADGTRGVNRFDLTQISYNRQIGNGLASFNMRQLAFFGQDSWKVSKSLTIDLGLRWEGQFNPKVEANNDAVLARANNIRFPLGSLTNVTSIPDAAKQVMPRFGFAYSPITSSAKRLVLRGFTGLFYGATPMLSFAGPVNNFRVPPGDVSIGFGNTVGQPTIYQAFLQAGVDLNRTPIDQLAAIPVEQVTRAAAIANGGVARDPYVGASFLAMAADFKNPRAAQAGLGVETEIFTGFTTGVQFHYVNTSNLLRNRNYNLAIPAPAAGDQTGRPIFGVRPNTNINQLTIRESSSRAMYRAATLSAQYRSKRFQFQTFYTLAENFSNDDNERDAGGFVYENSFNLIPEYNYANMDIRGQFTSNAVVTLPWGIELGGIFRGRSGLPYNAVAGSDLNRDGNNNDRPYFAANTPMLRNSFRNRGTAQADLRIMKSIRLKDTMRVQLSSELFNLFNHSNVVFAGASNIYGAGMLPNGTFAPVDARFMRLKDANGLYDRNNVQVGNPFQAQFAVRFFF